MTYRRAHTRVVNGKTVHVRGSKVKDPAVSASFGSWLGSVFGSGERDDDEDDPPVDRFASERSWIGCSPDCPECRAIADET